MAQKTLVTSCKIYHGGLGYISESSVRPFCYTSLQLHFYWLSKSIFLYTLKKYFESMNCIHANFNARDSSSSFFSWNIYYVYHLSRVRPCASSSISLFYDPYTWVPLVYFKKGPDYLTRDTVGYLFLWLDVCCRVWFQVVFLLFWSTHYYHHHCYWDLLQRNSLLIPV